MEDEAVGKTELTLSFLIATADTICSRCHDVGAKVHLIISGLMGSMPTPTTISGGKSTKTREDRAYRKLAQILESTNLSLTKTENALRRLEGLCASRPEDKDE